MSKVNSILDERMKKPAGTTKMAAMARQSANGNLSSFSGIFSIAELSDKEKEVLSEILKNYSDKEEDIASDLNFLISLTSEVKAINNQAALLHGERIKKAHTLLTRYRDGAFTAWLIAAYGNRQTPYNLMQYYEFMQSMPNQLHKTIELMPRQAVYALATRAGSLEKKRDIVENYQGETKVEMLARIREAFPLNRKDGRKQKLNKVFLMGLKNLCEQIKQTPLTFTPLEKKEALSLLDYLQQRIGR